MRIRALGIVAGLTWASAVPAFAQEEGRVEVLPAARVWQTQTPAATTPRTTKRCVPKLRQVDAPVVRLVREPIYKTVRKPVYETRCVPVYRTRRVPQYEEVEVKVWGTREVPSVRLRKVEVYKDIEEKVLEERMVPCERLVHEDKFEYGERAVRGKVTVPRFVQECDPRTRQFTERARGCTTVEIEVGRQRTKTLTGTTAEMKPRGVRPTWERTRTRTRKVFAGVKTEEIPCTRTERYVVETRRERRVVGYKNERVQCGTRNERVEVSHTTERVCVGTRVREVPAGTRSVAVTTGTEVVDVLNPPPPTRRRRVNIPALRVTVVPDGTVGTALPGTQVVLTESEFQAARKARLANK